MYGNCSHLYTLLVKENNFPFVSHCLLPTLSLPFIQKLRTEILPCEYTHNIKILCFFNYMYKRNGYFLCGYTITIHMFLQQKTRLFLWSWGENSPQNFHKKIIFISTRCSDELRWTLCTCGMRGVFIYSKILYQLSAFELLYCFVHLLYMKRTSRIKIFPFNSILFNT